MSSPRCTIAAILFALPLVAVSLPRVAHAQWTDVTTPALAETTYMTDKKGVAFLDFDGDGDQDICLAGEGYRPIKFVRNDGGGVWTDITPSALMIPGSGDAQTWGDFDNDGDLDLFVSFEEEPMRLFRNDGGGVFTNITSGVLAQVGHGHSAAWVDVDRDGLLDLYFADLKHPSKLLRNVGGGNFVDITTDSLGVLFGDGVAWGDYDNDGDPDVYLIRFDFHPNQLMRNDGSLTFTNATAPPLGNSHNGHSGAWADFDNDGDLDLYFVNANGPNHLLRNDGAGVFTDATPASLVLGTNSVGECWGDFDNDGWLDLYVTSQVKPDTSNGVSHLFHNDHNGNFTEITSGPLFGTGTQAGVAAGDYDGDGDLDLFVSSYLSRPNHLFRNDLANGNHWLEVDVRGGVSNRTAIGARVYVTAGGMTQMREISGCTGYRSQNALTQHFGLGAATLVNRVRVQWPSGIIRDTTVVAADHRILLVEPSTIVAVPHDRGARVTLAAAMPNPVFDRTQLDYTLPATSEVRFTIVDAQGRLVRTLDRGIRGPGLHGTAWNGRNDAGARVAGGIYWCVLDAAGQRITSRFAVVR